jgi:hypothetical protein
VIRCTCLYRASTPDEQSAGSAALAVSVRDPFCPAALLHARSTQRPAGQSSPARSDEWPLPG